MDKEGAKNLLINLLTQAFSGELAAALAYEGHAESVYDVTERKEILDIRNDELHHRERVLLMMRELGGSVEEVLECKMNIIGKTVSILCRIGKWLPGGWFFSMYGAGRLESKNIDEYERAARHAWVSGNYNLVGELLEFAEVEWEHEKYFRDKVNSHVLSRWVPLWKIPPEKQHIRESFVKFTSDYNALDKI